MNSRARPTHEPVLPPSSALEDIPVYPPAGRLTGPALRGAACGLEDPDCAVAKLRCVRHGLAGLEAECMRRGELPGAPLMTSAWATSRVGAPGTISAEAGSEVAGVFASVLSSLDDAARAGLSDACLSSVFARRSDMVDGGESATAAARVLPHFGRSALFGLVVCACMRSARGRGTSDGARGHTLTAGDES